MPRVSKLCLLAFVAMSSRAIASPARFWVVVGKSCNQAMQESLSPENALERLIEGTRTPSVGTITQDTLDEWRWRLQRATSDIEQAAAQRLLDELRVGDLFYADANRLYGFSSAAKKLVYVPQGLVPPYDFKLHAAINKAMYLARTSPHWVTRDSDLVDLLSEGGTWREKNNSSVFAYKRDFKIVDRKGKLGTVTVFINVMMSALTKRPEFEVLVAANSSHMDLLLDTIQVESPTPIKSVTILKMLLDGDPLVFRNSKKFEALAFEILNVLSTKDVSFVARPLYNPELRN